MSTWISVAEVAACPSGQGIEVAVGGRVIALFNVDGEFFALDGVCPHQGGPLGNGVLNGMIVTCPWHGWQFDVRTGQHQISANICQPSLPVQVKQGNVQVQLPPENGCLSS